MGNNTGREYIFSPIERYHEIQRINNYFCKMLKVEAYTAIVLKLENYYSFMYNCLILFSMLYTIAVYDFETRLRAITFLGLGIQGITKFMVYFMYKDRIRSISLFLEKVYMDNNKCGVDGSNYDILDNSSTILMKLVKVFIIILGLILLSIFAMGILAYFNGQLLCAFYLPGLDESTIYGLTILFVFQMICSSLAVLGSIASDLVVFILTFHLWPLSDIIRRKTSELNTILTAAKRLPNLHIKLCIFNIAKIHQDFQWITTELTETLYIGLSVEMYSNTAGLIFSLYGILTIENNFILYMMFMMTFTKMIAYSALGTFYEIMCDRVYDSMFEINHYALDAKDKKTILQMLVAAQRPQLLDIGVQPLNLDTFVSLMKTVYSTAMLLISSLD